MRRSARARSSPRRRCKPLTSRWLSRVGHRIADVCDFGDEWPVRLTLREQTESDDGAYPRVLQCNGTGPPQYPDFDEEELVD